MELFLFSTLFIMVQARINLLAMRGYNRRKSSLTLIINSVGSISTIAIIVFGFMNFEWWIPIVSLLGMSFIANFIVNRAMALFFGLEAITDIIITILCIYMWCV